MRRTKISSIISPVTSSIILLAAGCIGGEDDLDPDPDLDDIEAASPGNWQLPPDIHALGQMQFVAYDGAPPWDNGAHCNLRQLPGTTRVGNYLLHYFPQITHYDPPVCRQNTADPSKTSVHGIGRALDLYIPEVGGQADNGKGDPVGNWLVANAEWIGIQYIIWDRTDWQANAPGDKASPYGGPVPHTNHLHVELSVEASSESTGWFQDRGYDRPPGGRPSSADWYALSGDWNGDGKESPGHYNIRTHQWILSNHNSGGGVDATFLWGSDGYLPVVGDWDGNGTDTPGLYSPSAHVWKLSNHNAGGGVDVQFAWGGDGSAPLAGDWNGDGVDTPGLYYASAKIWVLSNHNSAGGVDAQFAWGPGGWIPVVGDWNGDGVDSPGLYEPGSHGWVLSNHNTGGGVDAQFLWGGDGGLPVMGDWNGDGKSTPGLFYETSRRFILSNVNSGGGVAADFGWGPVGDYTVVGAR